MNQPDNDQTVEIRRIQNLAMHFPTLRAAPGIDPWDPKALDRWACTVASTGELNAARLILGVWNRDTPWECGKFDVFRAILHWDENHREAFHTWVVCGPYQL